MAHKPNSEEALQERYTEPEWARRLPYLEHRAYVTYKGVERLVPFALNFNVYALICEARHVFGKPGRRMQLFRDGQLLPMVAHLAPMQDLHLEMREDMTPIPLPGV